MKRTDAGSEGEEDKQSDSSYSDDDPRPDGASRASVPGFSGPPQIPPPGKRDSTMSFEGRPSMFNVQHWFSGLQFARFSIGNCSNWRSWRSWTGSISWKATCWIFRKSVRGNYHRSNTNDFAYNDITPSS